MAVKKISRCPYCSAQIKVSAEDTFVVCEYCGREMEVPRFTQEEKRLTQAVEEMKASSEAAAAALNQAMERAEESDAQMEKRIEAMAEAQAQQSVQARMHRDELLKQLRQSAIEQRESARTHLNELRNEQNRLKNALEDLRQEQQAGKAASLQHCYELGENAQRAGRFDEAIGHFQELLVMSEELEAEVHWRIVMCRYGVEYVREQSSETWLPTITHMIVDSVQDDADYLAAEKYARSERMRAYYREEARRIDDILDKYRQVYGQERHYDVFISVKQGDENGRPTEDSMIAMELYYMLSGMGLHVFNSRISLQEHAGLEYEPYIMAALMTSRVMLVVGTRSEYMHAPWVRNEWRRFRWLQENGRDSRRLVAYIVGMKTSEIPKEMGALQIINTQVSGDPKGNLRRIVEKEFGNRSGMRKNASQEEQTKRLRRAELFLEEGNIAKCEEYLEMALENNPEAGMAYALRLCIARGVNRIDKLGRLTESIADDLNFRRAMSFGDKELQRKMTEINESVQKNLRAEAERKAQEERERVEAERKAREERERAEAERKARDERERAEAERKAREARERAEAERKAREERERAEAERKAREERERLEQEFAERMRARAEAERKAREEREREAQEFAERTRARAEAQRKIQEARERDEAEYGEWEEYDLSELDLNYLDPPEKAQADAGAAAQIAREQQERLNREKAERERAEQERLNREKGERERAEQERLNLEKEQHEQAQELLKRYKEKRKAKMRAFWLAVGVIAVFAVVAFSYDYLMDIGAMNGDPSLMRRRAEAYRYGEGMTRQNDEKAVEWFIRAANAGDSSAHCTLYWLYMNGDCGLEQDLAAALEHLLAADMSSGLTATYIADVGGIERFTAAAESDPDIAAMLANMYADGIGVEQDVDAAERWSEKAFAQNIRQSGTEEPAPTSSPDLYASAVEADANGNYELAVNLLAAEGMTQDLLDLSDVHFNKAEELSGDTQQEEYRVALMYANAAAEQDNTAAMVRAGYQYTHGLGVETDHDRAYELFLQAANAGNTSAMNNLGWMLECGAAPTGVPSDAIEWYRKASDAGNATASRNLGVCYYNGDVVQQDYAEAMRYFRLAIEQGDSAGRAQENLGFMYLYGQGTEVNVDEAIRLLNEAVSLGNYDACYELGSIYLDYEDYRNFQKAFEYFELGARYGSFEQGDCAYMAGHMLEGGDLGTMDLERALRYYAFSARLGDEDAITACKEWGINDSEYSDISEYPDPF